MATHKRPTFARSSDEERRLSALLAEEMLRWPGVRLGKMFGMTSVYRGKKIFALLSHTRALFAAHSIAIKHRGKQASKPSHTWNRFDLPDESALRAALVELDKAYCAAK